MSDELIDLENLLRHPGWLRLTEHGLTDINNRVMTATRNAANLDDDVKALNALRQCIAARDAVEALIAWPTNRVKGLRDLSARETTTTQFSRRGDL